MSNNDTFFIEDIVNEFPFFQAARALQLKGLKDQNSFRYNEVLKTTAVYSTDRSILFNFITSTDFENTTLRNNEAQLIAELETKDESIKSNIEHFELNATDEEVENLNHLIELHDIKLVNDKQDLTEFNDPNDFFKIANETIENKEIDLIKEDETEQHHFYFDKLDVEVKEEKEMTFEEEIEKIASEFLRKIESEHRTFEPDPEFKLEEATTSHFNPIENESTSIQENEKSKIIGDKDLEAELISHFEKFESVASSEILIQKEDDIENEMREHFKKFENQSIEEESSAIREDYDKKDKIKHEIIDYFTHLDKEVVLDDDLFEKMTHDLPNELKQEIENEIILHFTQSSAFEEVESNKKIENNSVIDPIEAETITHFNELSSASSEETKTEIPNAPIEDPIEKEIREHFAKYNQGEENNELETIENASVQEKVKPLITNEKIEEAIEQEEIIFELLPREIFSQTLADEKTNIEEKIDLNLDEDFSPPVQFHRNDTHSFNEWLKLSSFKPINREVEPEKAVSIVKKMEIIDEFLDKNPKIETLKNEVSKEELINNNIDNEEIMTETLARVYVMQHKYSDAIRAYQILSLKFPEKSSFFADQIKQIENFKRNNLH